MNSSSCRLLLIAITLMVVAQVRAQGSGPSRESKFLFKIRHQYVNGDDNDVEHKLTRGALTIAGEIWASSCAIIEESTGQKAKPMLVKIVVKEEGLFGGEKCSFSVLPSAKVGEKVSFGVTCDTVSEARFYLVAYTHQNPETRLNCTIEATGTLTTK